MLRQHPTNTYNWIFIIGIVLLFLELFLLKPGLIFGIAFLSFLVYIGWRSYQNMVGKVFFWVGVIGLFFTLINLIALRFIIAAVLVMFFVNYQKTKKNPDYISLEIMDEDINSLPEPLVKVESLFSSKLFGDQKTSETPYQWRDVNIHGGIGDRVIDLSNTVLPEEAVISVRHLIGNIKVYVPYEVEVHVHHSSVFGRASVFHKKHVSLFNQSFTYQTENFPNGKPRVKIFTSLLSGDIEVKRI
ncbi:cell wall-active antibiotics response protein [Bacillus alkalicola]|uniref:Cell wall-active antibiotics response protein n=1 Tax=Evansella alkalicola TaxID=745819 RepID=A0ABS6JTL4_9BACI|nr:cell wall-active antibiotics response protein [Bacillus alkalicola]